MSCRCQNQRIFTSRLSRMTIVANQRMEATMTLRQMKDREARKDQVEGGAWLRDTGQCMLWT